MHIRPETAADFAAIADVHICAFGYQAYEATVVALMRQRWGYDPTLSLVAEDDGRVVGHVLFTPFTIRLMDEDVKAVLVAPVGVHPDHQGRGVGSALMEAGHEAARSHGIDISFLTGHITYYPRFGYQGKAFGGAQLQAHVDGLSCDDSEAKTTTPADIPALMAMWREQEAAVDFSIQPEAFSVDWLSPGEDTRRQARTFWRDGRIVGYSRGQGRYVRVFMALDRAAAHCMAVNLARRASKVALPLHPSSKAAAFFEENAVVNDFDAAFALPLSERGATLFKAYRAAVAAGERLIGRCIWPVSFD